MTLASSRPAVRSQFKTRKSRGQKQGPLLAFINDNCFENAFQMREAKEVGSCGEVRFTRQVGISKVQFSASEHKQTFIYIYVSSGSDPVLSEGWETCVPFDSINNVICRNLV